MAVISTRRSIRVKPARFKKVVEAVAAASETCQLTTVALLEIEYGEVNPDKADCILPSYSFCMAVHEPLLLQEEEFVIFVGYTHGLLDEDACDNLRALVCMIVRPIPAGQGRQRSCLLDLYGLQHGKAHYKLVNQNRDLVSSDNAHCHCD